jgi:hypothetical protein
VEDVVGWEVYENLTVRVLRDWYDHIPVPSPPPDDVADWVSTTGSTGETGP